MKKTKGLNAAKTNQIDLGQIMDAMAMMKKIIRSRSKKTEVQYSPRFNASPDHQR